jgi:hypothetical protein
MARIRTIKPEFPQSESMGRVSREARLCFILLWTIADDSGRLRGNSRMLASLLYPYDDDAKKHIDRWLDELETEHCLTRYNVEGDRYIQITEWAKHQKIDKPTPSKIPEHVATPREDSRELSKALEASPLEGKGREGKGGGEEPSDPPAEAVVTPPFILIPLSNNTEFKVELSSVAEFKAAYPAVDVEQQLREMRTWSITNAKNRKTPAGVMSFINRWLAKEQDKAPRVAGAAPSSQWAGAI